MEKPTSLSVNMRTARVTNTLAIPLALPVKAVVTNQNESTRKTFPKCYTRQNPQTITLPIKAVCTSGKAFELDANLKVQKYLVDVFFISAKQKVEATL
jgi:hypothetical protein